MESYFNSTEKEIIQSLKQSTPNEIWIEYGRVIFNYNQRHAGIQCLPIKADTQNRMDEAMTANIYEKDYSYKPSTTAKIVLENPQINNVNIVRTLLYFTDSIDSPAEVKKLDSKWNRIMSYMSGVKKSEIEKILEGTTSSYHDEIICHPNSHEAQNVDKKYSNKIDVGLLIEINEYYLPVFIQENQYGFTHLEKTPFISKKNLKKEVLKYEIIT